MFRVCAHQRNSNSEQIEEVQHQIIYKLLAATFFTNSSLRSTRRHFSYFLHALVSNFNSHIRQVVSSSSLFFSTNLLRNFSRKVPSTQSHPCNRRSIASIPLQIESYIHIDSLCAIIWRNWAYVHEVVLHLLIPRGVGSWWKVVGNQSMSCKYGNVLLAVRKEDDHANLIQNMRTAIVANVQILMTVSFFFQRTLTGVLQRFDWKLKSIPDVKYQTYKQEEIDNYEHHLESVDCFGREFRSLEVLKCVKSRI